MSLSPRAALPRTSAAKAGRPTLRSGLVALLSSLALAACSKDAPPTPPDAGTLNPQPTAADAGTSGAGAAGAFANGGRAGGPASAGSGPGGAGAGRAAPVPDAATAPDAAPPGATPGACIRPGEASDRPVLETLSRGLVAVKTDDGVYLGFRLLGTDPPDAAFNLYRGTTKLNDAPLTGPTNHLDRPGDPAAQYTVARVAQGMEGPQSAPVSVWPQSYLTVPLDTGANYVPGDASAADLDGDGDYELVVKQEQTPLDNSQAGATGETLLEAYELDGTLLWRIKLGQNIREGAHYTQFMVYDFDGDGRAEVACKTADGTVDGTGKLLGDAGANHRNSDGYVLTGPEFLTVFDGQTGAEIHTVDYVPGRGRVADWGDDYGNRVDRFLAGVAYLDGVHPSLIMARGYYTRTVLVAWDLRAGKLEQRWIFDSDDGQSEYAGQGNHNLSVADVDGDGRQEIIYGGMAIDDDGSPLWTSGYGHGDALHVSDMDESLPGLEVWRIQERPDRQGAHLLAAASGELLFAKASSSDAEEGPGRGAAGDILASNPGYELWANGGGVPVELWNAKGENIGRQPSSCNFLIFWDGDAQRELLDGNHIDKYGASGEMRLLTADGCSSNNGTKSTPALSADLLGDFREELILRTDDNRSLRIYTTTDPSELRVPTLMHDPQYRVAIAWQNVAYNQPPHPSFLLHADQPPKTTSIATACLPE